MFKLRSLHLVLIVLLAVSLLSACGGGGNGGGDTGNLRVFHNLASSGQFSTAAANGLVSVGPEATDFTFTGLNSSGTTVYGPVTLPRAPEHLLTGVPQDVTQLNVDYRNADGSLHASARSPVRVTAGETSTVTALATKTLTVQLVNESGLSDDDVYVLLSANGDIEVDTEGGDLAVYGIGTGSADVTSKPLSDLHKLSAQRVSPLTGKSHNVYEFMPTKVVSGRLWISYNGALTYKQGDVAPDNFEPNVRYDKMEMGYSPGDPTGYFDLTSVDFFAIPMQLEVLADPGDDIPFRVTTFYTSTLTLLKAIFNLDAGTMADAFYETGTPPVKGWIPNTDQLDDFVRVMSPATLASQVPAQSGDPYTAAPYPSFANYLTDLANAGAYVDLSGKNGVDGGILTQWDYRAAVASDKAGGFVVTCQPLSAMNNSPQGSLGDSNYPQDQTLPADLTVEVALNKDFFDQFIYGVPANAFSVKDLDCHLIPYSKNSVYADIAGNFLAGLNFGYVDGRYGTDAAHWFDVLPGYPPYGAARPSPDDGYYNPYAAVLYNLSDAYSYAISDRLAIGNPLVTTSPDKPYLRITILPDDRLDAPGNVQVTPGSDGTSFNVTWDAIATPPADFTLTGYRVIAADGSVPVVAPSGPPPTEFSPNQIAVKVNAGETSTPLPGLNPNTVYKVSVVAEGEYQGNPVTSTVGNFAVAATPPETSAAPTSFITFDVGVSEPADAPEGTTYKVDGMSVTNTQNQPLQRPAPDQSGGLVQALFEVVGPDPANPGSEISYSQTNVFFNAFDAGNSAFNAYFNFPFSSTVPTTTQLTTLPDGSTLNFGYGPTFGSNNTPQPPFGNTANSLVLTVAPNPTNRPKTPAAVTLPSLTPVVPNPSVQPAPAPGYTPAPYTPVACPQFTVQAVLGAGSPVTDISDLKGATVQFVRLVTYPGAPGSAPQMPAADGSGADAQLTLDDTGKAVFNPQGVPYNAPIWNVGYAVDVIYHDAATNSDSTYSAYGAWTTAAVGSEWKSGLTGQTDQPGVIYVPVYPSPTGQVVWGN